MESEFVKIKKLEDLPALGSICDIYLTSGGMEYGYTFQEYKSSDESITHSFTKDEVNYYISFNPVNTCQVKEYKVVENLPVEIERDYKQEAEDASRKLIIDFSDAVNNFGFDTKAFIHQFRIEHNTLQQNIFRVILQLISSMTKDEYRTDGRNEGSKKLAKKIIAGYAEIEKREYKVMLMNINYDEKTAEEKAEKYRLDIITSPEKYIGLSHI